MTKTLTTDTQTWLPSFFEEEYMLYRMEAAHCRAMGDAQSMKRAIRLAWKARCSLRFLIANPED